MQVQAPSHIKFEIFLPPLPHTQAHTQQHKTRNNLHAHLNITIGENFHGIFFDFTYIFITCSHSYFPHIFIIHIFNLITVLQRNAKCEEVLLKRARHVITEIKRTQEAADALKNHDFKKVKKEIAHTNLPSDTVGVILNIHLFI